MFIELYAKVYEKKQNTFSTKNTITSKQTKIFGSNLEKDNLKINIQYVSKFEACVSGNDSEITRQRASWPTMTSIIPDIDHTVKKIVP